MRELEALNGYGAVRAAVCELVDSSFPYAAPCFKLLTSVGTDDIESTELVVKENSQLLISAESIDGRRFFLSPKQHPTSLGELLFPANAATSSEGFILEQKATLEFLSPITVEPFVEFIRAVDIGVVYSAPDSTVSFDSEPGYQYSIEYSEDLKIWNGIRNVIGDGGAVMHIMEKPGYIRIVSTYIPR